MPRIQGGMGIINPKANRPGTIGLIAAKGASRYLVSCYHVLCRPDLTAFQKGEPIYLAADVNQAVPVARAEQGLADLDAAAALVVDGVEAFAGIIGLAPLAEPAEPEEGMTVVKVGHATGKTEGQICRVEADDVWIEPLAGAAGGPISGGGDSGTVWVWKDTWAPVVLHTGTNDTGVIPYARGLSLLRALDSLGLKILSGG